MKVNSSLFLPLMGTTPLYQFKSPIATSYFAGVGICKKTFRKKMAFSPVPATIAI
jgi:hypothetical protein